MPVRCAVGESVIKKRRLAHISRSGNFFSFDFQQPEEGNRLAVKPDTSP